MNLPEPTYKPGKPYEHIDPTEYHSLFEYEERTLGDLFGDNDA